MQSFIFWSNRIREEKQVRRVSESGSESDLIHPSIQRDSQPPSFTSHVPAITRFVISGNTFIIYDVSFQSWHSPIRYTISDLPPANHNTPPEGLNQSESLDSITRTHLSFAQHSVFPPKNKIKYSRYLERFRTNLIALYCQKSSCRNNWTVISAANVKRI